MSTSNNIEDTESIIKVKRSVLVKERNIYNGIHSRRAMTETIHRPVEKDLVAQEARTCFKELDRLLCCFPEDEYDYLYIDKNQIYGIKRLSDNIYNIKEENTFMNLPIEHPDLIEFHLLRKYY